MDAKNLVLLTGSSEPHAGTSLGYAVMAAEVAERDRTVVLHWKEDRHIASKSLVLNKPPTVIIPAGESGVVFVVMTNNGNHGVVQLTATLEDGSAEDYRRIEVKPALIHIYDALDIPISLSADAATTPHVNDRLGFVWPIATSVQITVVADSGTANVLVKNLDLKMTVYNVDPATGQQKQNSDIKTFFDAAPDIPFMASRQDENSFSFHLDPTVPNGTYSVHVDVTISAHDLQPTDFVGRRLIEVLFVKP